MANLFQCRFYRHILIYPLLATLVAVVSEPQNSVLAQQATTQNTESDESAETAQIETFQLRYANAQIVSDVLQTLLAGESGVRMAIGEDNRVIVRGTPETLTKVRETLKVLDRAPEDPSVVKVVSLLHSEARIIADLVEQIVGDVKVAFDSRTNSLVISAPSETSLNKVEALARVLDQGNEPLNSVGTYNLELFWLIERDDDEDGDSANTAPVDGRVANAVIELQRHGFAGAQQVGHLSVVVRAGGKFRVRSNESAGELHLLGTLNEISKRQLELTLELEISHQTEEVASVMTEINTQPDHEVVIGIAGAMQPERRSAFVIRVEKVKVEG